jgi:hypothetical protein
MLAIVLMIAGSGAARPQAVDAESSAAISDDCCRTSTPDEHKDDGGEPRPCRNCGAVCCTGLTALVTTSAFAVAIELDRTVNVASVQSDRCTFADPLLDPPRA